jgi:hypothetical protein
MPAPSHPPDSEHDAIPRRRDPELPLSGLDVEIRNCRYPAYELLRNEAPVWRDPRTGFFVITRFEDLRAALLDTTPSTS